MFVQIHMLQSMPPGNLNRDDTGQPKKCVFGGVTRGRVSSQCLKRRIRLSPQFKTEFGDNLATRTQYLPRMVADILETDDLGIPEDELEDLMRALAKEFKKKGRTGDSEVEGGGERVAPSRGASSTKDRTGKTGQLVFFQQPYARRIAELLAELRKCNEQAYRRFIGRRGKSEPTKEKEDHIERFREQVLEASKTLTVDIGLFGRMTTSDLIVNVEAACQVAHAISTHETLIESDWFSAMDDEKDKHTSAQMDKSGAAFIGAGGSETFFNSAVYYKYLNLDLDALKRHLPSLSNTDAARVVGVLLGAAALANPSGKQNSFAAHSVPEFILVELAQAKRPLSYANAFLQPVEGGANRNLMTESAKALCEYIDPVAAAFVPPNVVRRLLAVGPASVELKSEHKRDETLDGLVESVIAETGKTA